VTAPPPAAAGVDAAGAATREVRRAAQRGGSDRRDAVTRPLRVALVGNPNTGKTTLFNALTGLRQKVGNFAGVTVERSEGTFRAADGQRVSVLDLPGSYSLSAGSPDEAIALEVLLAAAGRAAARRDRRGGRRAAPRAQPLPRRQVLELGRPVVVALNQVDAARAPA
jgi:ferrous iron transport protein B